MALACCDPEALGRRPDAELLGKECRMQNSAETAKKLTLRVFPRVLSAWNFSAQELPRLTFMGAVIARSARHVAGHGRAPVPKSPSSEIRLARLVHPGHATRSEQDALFADLNPDEGRIVAASSRPAGSLWRFHAAPTPAGARIACSSVGAHA
jgi:hypothetical protein